jgi:hypothetical protein
MNSCLSLSSPCWKETFGFAAGRQARRMSEGRIDPPEAFVRDERRSVRRSGEYAEVKIDDESREGRVKGSALLTRDPTR